MAYAETLWKLLSVTRALYAETLCKLRMSLPISVTRALMKRTNLMSERDLVLDMRKVGGAACLIDCGHLSSLEFSIRILAFGAKYEVFPRDLPPPGEDRGLVFLEWHSEIAEEVLAGLNDLLVMDSRADDLYLEIADNSLFVCTHALD